MAYLTLIGGPYAKRRTGDSPPFTVPVLHLGGADYARSDRSSVGDAVYVFVPPHSHMFDDWYMREDGRFIRFCQECPEVEVLG